MENKIFLNRHRLSLGWNGLPVELHRTPTATMYRGQELESGREMAIELVPFSSTDPVFLEQLEEEAAAAKLIKQLNIPTLYDFGVEDGQLVYVTEYFDGHTAEAWVAARGPLPTAAVLRIAVQVADALRSASFHHLYHRALCPANIVFVPALSVLGEWPVIKVLHWLGLPTNFTERPENDERIAAAAHFASPEQLRGEEVDFPSATYSLGCTMWFLLTGVVPVASTQAVEGTNAIFPDAEKLRGLPKIVRHLLGRMLRADPAERPQDPVALLAFLQTCLARVTRRDALNRRLGLPIGVRPRVVERGAARTRPIRTLAVAAAILLVCAALAAIAMPRYFRAHLTAQANTPNVSAPGRGIEDSSASARKGEPKQKSKMAVAASARPKVMAVKNTSMPKLFPKPPTAAASVKAPDSSGIKAAQPQTPTEAAPPEEGPATVIASNLDIPEERLPEEATPSGPAKTDLPNEAGAASAEAPSDFLWDEPPSIADSTTKLPPPVASVDAAVPAAPENDAAKPAKTISNQKKATTRSATAKPASHRKKATSSAKVALTRVHKGPRVAHALRAEKLPLIHIGSSRAELVGTTADGQWILSVASSGQRVIVPPPPGYGR